MGRQRTDLVAKDLQTALCWEFEPGDHPQRGGLAATGWAEHGEELTVGDLHVDGVNGHHVIEALCNPTDLHRRCRRHSPVPQS